MAIAGDEIVSDTKNMATMATIVGRSKDPDYE